MCAELNKKIYSFIFPVSTYFALNVADGKFQTNHVILALHPFGETAV